MAGNANSGNRHKDRPFRDALMIAIKAREGDQRGLRKIAENLLDLAENSELAAISALADRIDGKPAQQIDVGNVEGEEFKTVNRIELVAPSLTDDNPKD
jgi:hypothetical protein